MMASKVRTKEEFEALAKRHNRSEQFNLTLEKAYPKYNGRYIRATMRHNGHVIQTVVPFERIGPCVQAMRRELNKGNFCPTCGALR